MLPRIRAASALLILAAVAATVTAVDALAPNVLRRASFDSPSDRITSPAGEAHHLLTEGAQTFFMPYQGVSATPWLSTSVAMSGPHSLGLHVGPSAAGQTENDRSEFTVAHQGDPGSLQLDQDRWFGFAMYFNTSDFPAPAGEIIVAQIWQPTSPALGGPPAFIKMLPGKNDLSFGLATRDDRSTASVPVPLSCSHFERDRWNSVVLHIVPRPDNDPNGPGLIEMWLNGTKVGSATRSWGYAPPRAQNVFDVRAGLYANVEPAAHAVWLDDVRFGTTQKAVTPPFHAVIGASPVAGCQP